MLILPFFVYFDLNQKLLPRKYLEKQNKEYIMKSFHSFVDSKFVKHVMNHTNLLRISVETVAFRGLVPKIEDVGLSKARSSWDL